MYWFSRFASLHIACMILKKRSPFSVNSASESFIEVIKTTGIHSGKSSTHFGGDRPFGSY